jgi:transposase InsO family protein
LDSIVNLPPDGNDNTCILVVIDNFTKFVELFAVADVSAVTAAQCLLSVVGRYGCVETIRSDRGGQFVSEVFRHLVKLMGSKQLLTIGYRPQGNVIVERVNAEVIRHLAAIVHARRIKNM